MKKRSLLAKKIEQFYIEVKNKRKNKRTRLQTDLEFNQSEIKKLKKKFNIEMFHTRTRGSKAFAAEQKIREFKKLLLKMKNIVKSEKKRLKPNEIIRKITLNMNNTKTQKYQIEPEKVERKSLSSLQFKEEFDFYRLEKVGKDIGRQERYNNKKDQNNPKKLREPLIGEKVLVLSERVKKKDAPGRLYKATTQNRSYFSKKIFIIKKRVITSANDWYYWLSEKNCKAINEKRYLRQELYALEDQWR